VSSVVISENNHRVHRDHREDKERVRVPLRWVRVRVRFGRFRLTCLLGDSCTLAKSTTNSRLSAPWSPW